MMSITEASFRIYDRLARRIVPGHKHTQYVYHEWLCRLLQPETSWLDLGCGHQILPAWVKADEKGIVAQCSRAVGIDLDFPSLQANRIIRNRIMGTLERLPFPDASFDLVTANMVIEHLVQPLAVLAEVKRVLQPGGRFLFHTPNRKAPAIRIAAHTPEPIKKAMIWLLERRKEEDVFETHYRMNTAQDVRTLAERAGMRVEELAPLSSVAVTAILGPLAVPELFFLRALQHERYQDLRSNLLAVLAKPSIA